VRIFLDANILFSAASTDGTVRRILSLLTEAGHQSCVNAYVVGEARRNIAFKSQQHVHALEVLLAGMVHVELASGAPLREELLLLPEKDRPVLDAAARGRCDVLLTGDRAHFGRWFGLSLAGVKIHSPKTLLLELLA
jgi:predicted nucleic acid-binding protein